MTATAERVERLNRASLKRVIEPDVDLPGALGDGQLMPDELLSTAGLDLDLTVDQRRTLSREEVASMFFRGDPIRSDPRDGLRPPGGLRPGPDRPPCHLPAARDGGGDPSPAGLCPARLPDRPPSIEPLGRQGLGRPPRPLRFRLDHPAPRHVVRARVGRRGDPRSHAETGVGASGHRPFSGRGQPLSPSGGGQAPQLRA